MLYIIATPIGNLEDITFRAIKILKQVDLILAEDTRRTNILLNKYEIDNKLQTFNDFNKEKSTPKIIEELKEKDIALVSDAGTPGISDPGFYLVREAVKHNIQIVPIPGASAITAALSASGLATDRFTFYGFLPKKSKKTEIIKQIKERNETAIIYESPYRINKTINALKEIIPDHPLVIGREITKKFEEFIRGTVSEVHHKIKDRELKGELVLIVGKK